MTSNKSSFGIDLRDLSHKYEESKSTNPESGVDVFLKNPSKYNFLCTSTSEGEVLGAELSFTGKMTIKYSSFWDDGDHSGIVVGVYDRKINLFVGTYSTSDGRFSGEINFSFNEKGEANGTWDNGYGTIKIHLKNQKI